MYRLSRWLYTSSPEGFLSDEFNSSFDDIPVAKGLRGLGCWQGSGRSFFPLHFVMSFCEKLYDGAFVFTFGFFPIEVISCSAQCECFLILSKHIVRKEGNVPLWPTPQSCPATRTHYYKISENIALSSKLKLTNSTVKDCRCWIIITLDDGLRRGCKKLKN